MAIASRITTRALSTFAAAKLPEAAVAAAGAQAVTLPSSSSAQQQQQQQVLEFEDTERLFTGEPATALVRTIAALQLMSAGPLVDVGLAALRAPAVAASPLVQAAARATAYKHFCAGETAEEAAARVQRLWRGGMGGILDYGIEDAEDGAACDRNVAGFLAAVDIAAALPPGSVRQCVRLPNLTLCFFFPSLRRGVRTCVRVGVSERVTRRTESESSRSALVDARIPWESSGTE